MTELNTFLIGLKHKECKDMDECFQTLTTGEYTHTFYTYEYRMALTDINKGVCMCFKPNNHMLKEFSCKGDCNKNRPFYVLDLKNPKSADMIDNFTSNVDFVFYLGGNIINKDSRILSLCSVFHGAYALIYIDQPNMPNEIIVSKRLHHFQDKTRRRIIQAMNPNGIIDGELIYKYGMAGVV